MASLAPPPAYNRHRASSTNVRPPLTLSSLGRRRSNSDLPPPCHTPSPVTTPNMQKELVDLSLDIPTPSHKLLAKATFVELYSRFMELFHLAQKESPYPSAPSSPRLSRASTSTEDSILPIASPTVAAFGDVYSEKPATKTGTWWQGAPSVRSMTVVCPDSCANIYLAHRSILLCSLLLLCSRFLLCCYCSPCLPSQSPLPGLGTSRT